MHYKTITLGLLQEEPALYTRLCQQRLLLPAMEHYARALRERHLAWKEVIGRKRPDSDSRQIASEALELAIEELRAHLPSASATRDPDALSPALSISRLLPPTPNA